MITVLPRLQFQGPYLYNGDPVAYFSGAESILEHGKYLVDGKTPIWPIGTSLTLIPFIQLSEILGGQAESGAFWHGMFFIFLAVAFTYLLGKRIFNPATGIIAAIFVSLAESPFIHSINSASDPGSLAMLLGAIYLMLLFLDTQSPRDLFLSFFMLGLAFVFRWNYVFFLPLFLIYLVGDRRIWAFHLYPSFWFLGFFGFVAGISIQLVTNYSHFGNPLQIGYGQLDYSEQFIFSGFVYIKNMVRIMYRMLFTWDFFSPLLAMFGVLAIIGLWKEKRRDVFWLIMPWVVLGSLSVVYFGVKPRLLMPIMPAMFLIGAEGIVRAFYALRKSLLASGVSARVSVIAFVLMGIILFSPMFVRTLLHSHGHFQDKVVMQQAFRWAGDNMSNPEGRIITQPYYAGQNPDWLRAGWDVWASKRYSGRSIKSLEFPETWATGNDWAVVNRFWFEGSSVRFENSREMAARFDSLCTSRNYELKMTFEAESEPRFLKKLNMLTYYPVDFLEYRPFFEVWGPVE
ncbi:MAG: glycosyltransferase family 39 protein [FCB group bacterium]|nr:glycosyltransferase family 39 protein [FCB group bacterium]MBL7122247.1 glycosyltransferase family 39 protein [Candidatus Neomarinimicrobiota bacterium]